MAGRSFAHAMIRPALAIIFSLALTGCIFLVDSLPDDTSTTCHLTTPEFSVSTTACKTCITDNCQKLLDVCCGDLSCQAQLSSVDECANDAECSALAQAGGTEGATTDLIACIANECPGECSGIDASPANDGSVSSCSTCKTSCVTSSDNQGCSCVTPSAAQPGNTTTCNSETFSNSICCESTDWPDVTTGSCTCSTLFCSTENDICSCQIGVSSGGSGNDGTCYPTTSSSCCISADQRTCTCDPNDACDQNGETTVDHCGTDTMSCPSGARSNPTSTCSE